MLVGLVAGWWVLAARDEASIRAAADEPKVAESTPTSEPVEVPSTTTVALEIRGVPPGTSLVDAQGEVLGATPGRITVASSTGAATFTLRHDGHRPRALTVSPDRDQVVHVTLEPTAPTPSA